MIKKIETALVSNNIFDFTQIEQNLLERFPIGTETTKKATLSSHTTSPMT